MLILDFNGSKFLCLMLSLIPFFLFPLRSVKMFSAQNKIKKDKNAEPTECEEQVAQVLTSTLMSLSLNYSSSWITWNFLSQALFDLENTNQELKSELKDLYINQAVYVAAFCFFPVSLHGCITFLEGKLIWFCHCSHMDISGNRKAVVIYVPFRLRKAFRKIHPRLVRELEKKFSGKVIL